MFSKVFVITVLGCIFGIKDSLVTAHCTPCLDPPTHYAELNCTGAMDSGDCCNTRFTCPDSVFEIFPDKCQHHGCLYGYSEKVGESILPSCVSEATCVESLDGPKFQLTREEPMPIEDDCLPQYTLENTCNPRGKICDPAEKEKLTKCYVRGEEYYEGQLFTPNLAPVFSKSCYRCICDANYNNDTLPASNANCRKLQCGIELTNIDQIRKGCVPVYASLTLYDAEPTTCCPIEYMCPDSNEKDTYRPSPTTPAKSCVFGDKIVGVGEPIETSHKCRTCKCITPPALTCIQTETC